MKEGTTVDNQYSNQSKRKAATASTECKELWWGGNEAEPWPVRNKTGMDGITHGMLLSNERRDLSSLHGLDTDGWPDAARQLNPPSVFIP